jgi:elongation factor G
MGELHLDILVDRLTREFRVKANVGKPQVAYKESITKQSREKGKFLKQIAGKNQFAEVVLEIEPNDPGKSLAFKNLTTPDMIPGQFIQPIKDGIKEAMLGGVLFGYPVIDVIAKLVGGSFDNDDSTELAFKIASSMALRNAAEKAAPMLMEPIMSVEVTVPEDFLGDVVNFLNTKRAKINNISARNNLQIVSSSVPLNEMFGYTTQLRSLTQGRATHSMQFLHYEKLPEEKTKQMSAGSYTY